MPDINAGDPALLTWNALNAALLTSTEKDCKRLLGIEQKHRRRRQFILRIHSRMNRLRRLRERTELTAPPKKRARK